MQKQPIDGVGRDPCILQDLGQNRRNVAHHKIEYGHPVHPDVDGATHPAVRPIPILQRMLVEKIARAPLWDEQNVMF